MTPDNIHEMPPRQNHTPIPKTAGELALEVQMLQFRVTQLETKIGRMTRVAWLLFGAVAGRLGWDVTGLGGP